MSDTERDAAIDKFLSKTEYNKKKQPEEEEKDEKKGKKEKKKSKAMVKY